MVDCLSFSLLLGSKNCFFRRYFFSHWFILDQAMVFDRIQPLHSVASPQTHDVFSQEANTLSYVHLLNLMGVTSLGRHTRPTCHQAPFEIVIKKKVDVDLNTVYFSWTSSDARGLGLIFVVCACVVGLRGNRLIRMWETWGVFWRSAHGPTTPFTWLRIVKVLGQTAHASCSLKLCEQCGSNSCLCVFFFPWGHVNFHDQIWALPRHLGHVCQMLLSDWLIQNLLRSDWLPPIVALLTTWASHICITDLLSVKDKCIKTDIIWFMWLKFVFIKKKWSVKRNLYHEPFIVIV